MASVYVSPMPNELQKSQKSKAFLETECFVFTVVAAGEGEFFPEGLSGVQISLAGIWIGSRTSIQHRVSSQLLSLHLHPQVLP